MFHPANAFLADTADALQNGTRDLSAYLHELCDRIDAHEPDIQAFLPEPQRRERLLREAAELCKQYPDPARRPPLFGIPVGVKDIFRADGFPTKAGAQLPPELFDGPEATCVTSLKKAGALIAGKTVTTEFASFEPGPTRNPYNPEHTPGGSSSGSAAGVACGFFPVAFGTQTIGSVIRPAAYCGILGFKPSFDRIAADGLIVLSKSLDHVGLFTQDVEGMERVCAVLCQNWQPRQAGRSLPVLGIPDGKYLAQASPEGLAAFETHITLLERAGYQVKRIPMFEDIERINQQHRQMMAAEAAQEHAAWFAAYRSLYRPRFVEIIEQGQQVSQEELALDRAGCLILRQQLHELQKHHGIDLWLSPPAQGDAPAGLHATGDPVMNLPWTYAGVPALTLPAGLSSRGLPLGLQCAAAFMQDEQLLAWAPGLRAALQTTG